MFKRHLLVWLTLFPSTVAFGAVHSDHLKLAEEDWKDLHLEAGPSGDLIGHAHVIAADTPWVAVIVPDDTRAGPRELSGIDISSNGYRVRPPSHRRAFSKKRFCCRLVRILLPWPILV
jgi:hypothetical protein